MNEQVIRRLTLPRWLGGRQITPAVTFASLFLLTTLCRTLVIAVIPLQAFEHLGSARAVSVMFLVVSVFGVCTGLAAPALVIRLGTRGVFHLAAGAACVAGVGLGMDAFPLFVAGLVAWAAATVGFEVTMNLYIMHLIRRRELGGFEPKRVLFMITAYTVGPWLGVVLMTEVAHWTPFALTVAAALSTVAWFHFLGLREAGGRARLAEAPNPLRHVRRFLAQPRLRLAWAIALARSAWWSTFMFYTPLYAVTSGLGEVAGGVLVSAGVATVYTVTLWGRLGRRRGIRWLLMLGFGASGVASITVAALAASPWLGAALLLFAALLTASIDAAGNVAFLRAVRPLEREEMTGVFSTYRDFSQLLPPAVFAFVLTFFPIQSVFAVAGGWMLAMTLLSRYVPRGL